jgi:hypothetical protein
MLADDFRPIRRVARRRAPRLDFHHRQAFVIELVRPVHRGPVDLNLNGSRPRIPEEPRFDLRGVAVPRRIEHDRHALPVAGVTGGFLCLNVLASIHRNDEHAAGV